MTGHVRFPLRSGADLVAGGLINSETESDLRPVLEQFSVSITPHIANIILKGDSEGAVSKQFVPSTAEASVRSDELSDPIGDNVHSPVKGIVHRYPDRVLLKLIHACPVYCRFCFRREQVGPGGEALSKKDLADAFAYIAGNTNIWEVILSGGDPLLISSKKLESVREKLDLIDHVRVLRIHSRIPIVDPERITPALVAALRGSKPTYVVIHSNHPDEFSAPARKACAMLADAGFPLLSQSVLLRGINDEPGVLARLFRTFVENRIKPYYLHQADLARGTSHFRTSIEEGQQIMKSLRGRMSGLCQPTYVLDIPGGYGKVPIGPAYIEFENGQACRITDPAGTFHDYRDLG